MIRTRLLFRVVLAAFPCVGLIGCNTEPADKELRWAEQVLLGPEFGGSGKICSRWVKSPKLSVQGATAEEEKVVSETVEHLNKTLARTRIKEVKLVKANDPDADILVYFAPLKDFHSLAKKHKFRYVDGNWGYFWTFWNGRHEIYQAYVLLASDKLQGKWLRHFALEEITQSLGLSNDSAEFSDSVFYANGDDGGNAQQLSDLDKKLIEFFYNHVEPGAKQGDLRAAYRKHWAKP